jgi:transmembrane sensor
VAADTARPNPEPLLVGAGHGATVPTSSHPAEPGSRPVTDADLQSRLAWRSPRLEFSGTPLIDAVALLNRHNRVQFTIVDPDLARTRVSGIFGARNTDSFVRLLESSFDVHSERRGADEIVLRRKP